VWIGHIYWHVCWILGGLRCASLRDSWNCSKSSRHKAEAEGRKAIDIWKILGVGLGLILLDEGLPDLIRYRAYWAAGNSSAVVFSTIEVVGGCWLIFYAFLKRQRAAEK
jgi:hypothetical protein